MVAHQQIQATNQCEKNTRKTINAFLVLLGVTLKVPQQPNEAHTEAP